MRTTKLNYTSVGGRVSNVDVKSGNNGYFGTVTIAVDDGYFKKGENGQDGHWEERTYFVDVKVDSHFLNYFKSPIETGDEVTLSGKLVQEKWKDNQSGQDRSALRVKGEKLIQHLRKVEVECLKQAGLVGNANSQNNAPQQHTQQNNHPYQQNSQQRNYTTQQNAQKSNYPRQQNAPQGGFAPNSGYGGYGQQQ